MSRIPELRRRGPQSAADAARSGAWLRRPAVRHGVSGLAVAVAGAGVTAAALGAVALIDFPSPSYLARMAMSSLVVLVAGLSLWAAASRGAPGWTRTLAGYLGPAAVTAIHLAFLLYGTRHYLNGVSGDQLNRLAYLGRFASSPALADAFYRDNAPFYPAAWFWVGGRLSSLLGVPAWEFYKPWAIATLAVASALAFVCWRAVVGERIAVPLALVTAAVGIHVAAYEPYSWIFVSVLPVVAVWAQRISHRRVAVALGVYLGLAAITYTLIAGIAAVVVTAAAALAFARTPRDGRGTRLRIAQHWVGIGLLSALIALVFWGPYLLSRLRGDVHERSVATDFAPELSVAWPLPMLELGGLAVLSLVGLVWLAWTLADSRHAVPAHAGRLAPEHRAREIAAALAFLALIGYAWFALSGLRAMGASTLLPFRLIPVIWLALACAGVFGLRSLREWTAAWAAEAGGARPRQVAAVGVVLVAVLTVQAAQQSSEEDLTFADTARSAPGRPDDLVAAVSDVTNGAEPDDVVVLSDDPTLYTFEPYWAFQAPAAAYASPTGRFEARNEAIAGWAGAADSRALHDAMRSGEFGAPDVLVLTAAPAPAPPADAPASPIAPPAETWSYSEVHNTMPLAGNIEKRPVDFDPALFSDPGAFRVERVGNLVVIGVL